MLFSYHISCTISHNWYTGLLDGGSVTPTVELNALAMKRGEPAIYRNIENRNMYYPPHNYDFRGMYNQRWAGEYRASWILWKTITFKLGILSFDIYMKHQSFFFLKILRAVPGKNVLGGGWNGTWKWGYHQHNFIFFMVLSIWIFQETPPTHLNLIDFSSTPPQPHLMPFFLEQP